jgi:hypothetical protein
MLVPHRSARGARSSLDRGRAGAGGGRSSANLRASGEDCDRVTAIDGGSRWAYDRRMDEPSCRECSRPVEPRFRFCPWCAAPLRLKAVEFFRAVEARDGDGDALRVSVYRPGDGVEPQVRRGGPNGDVRAARSGAVA